jgi:hypothetical protein
VHQRGEVRVAGADRERGDEPALQRQLHGVDGELDVRGVLARGAHPLRDLDELDLRAGQQPAVLVEVGPVGVGAADHDPPALGQRVGDRTEVERRDAEPVAGPDRQVLVVEEQRDALVVAGHRNPPIVGVGADPGRRSSRGAGGVSTPVGRGAIRRRGGNAPEPDPGIVRAHRPRYRFRTWCRTNGVPGVVGPTG